MTILQCVYKNFNANTMQLIATTFRETLFLALKCVKNYFYSRDDCKAYATSANRYASSPDPTASNPPIDCHSFSDEDYIKAPRRPLV